MRILADRIQAVMHERGWTFKVLAEETGISETMVERIANNRSNPTAPKIVELALVLDVSADWLLGLKDDRTP